MNEHVARLPGFANIRPSAPERMIQGALELMHRLERGFAEVSGLDRVTLQPTAGAQGELMGLMMIRAWHQALGRSPKKVLIPKTAHGTNPASCALNGLTARPRGPRAARPPRAARGARGDARHALSARAPLPCGVTSVTPPRAASLHPETGLSRRAGIGWGT